MRYNFHQNNQPTGQSSCPQNAPSPPWLMSNGQAIMEGTSLLSAQSAHAVILKAAVFHCRLHFLLISLQRRTVEILTSSPHSQVHSFGHLIYSIDLSAHSHWDPKKWQIHSGTQGRSGSFLVMFQTTSHSQFLESSIENTSRSLSPPWTLALTLGRLSSYYSHFCKELQKITKLHAPCAFSWLSNVAATSLLNRVHYTLGNMESLTSILTSQMTSYRCLHFLSHFWRGTTEALSIVTRISSRIPLK